VSVVFLAMLTVVLAVLVKLLTRVAAPLLAHFLSVRLVCPLPHPELLRGLLSAGGWVGEHGRGCVLT
jgi:hypothetical protein